MGFYFAYRPAKEQCAPGSACAMPATKRSGRLMLWLASGVVAFLQGFRVTRVRSPNFCCRMLPPEQLHNRWWSTQRSQSKEWIVQLVSVESKLKRVPGVRSVTVSFEQKRAEVNYDPTSATLSQMEKAIEDAGYSVRHS
jgi:copper chaperone CopZ